MIQQVQPGTSPAPEESLSLLGLNSLGGVGYWTLRKLWERFGSFRALLDQEPEALHAALLAAGAKARRGTASARLREHVLLEGAKRLNQLAGKGIRIVTANETSFPASLARIANPPYWLFIAGDVALVHKPLLAVVGTRVPSEDGRFLARFVGASLAQLQVPTVSGLANGIDETIHGASIRFKVPTVAVLGTGILQEFPRGSSPLREQILAHGGAVITEYMPKDSYSGENFVRRNRLQAGLARVVIPVEWQVRGGTAHTVRFAHAAGCEIVCMRLPDWAPTRPELLAAAGLGARIFTIPGEEAEFRIHVASAMAAANPKPARQLALWTGPMEDGD